MAKLSLDRQSLRLSWSEAVAGAELYVGKDVRAFASNWHFHEGWQVVSVTKGERRYEFKSGTVIAKPGQLVLLPPGWSTELIALRGAIPASRLRRYRQMSGLRRRQ